MAPSFDDWKDKLLRAAGDVRLQSPILNMGEHVLELLWRDGCEPTVTALLDYVQAGLAKEYAVEVSPSRSYRPSGPPRSSS